MPRRIDSWNIKAEKVPIEWHEGMSIYASDHFLRSEGDEYGWIGGISPSRTLRCILPYSIIWKAGIHMARFRVETIPMGKEFGIQEEKEFLTSAMAYLRSAGADLVIPATTNTIFRTYPDGAFAAPYSSFIVDLTQPLELIWGNISHKYRKDIRIAEKKGVRILSGIEYLEIAYNVIRETFRRSSLPFMGYRAWERMLRGLGDHMKLMIAEYQGVAQSCTAFHFSRYSAYAVHGGNIPMALNGAMKLIQWEAMKLFRELGVERFDFVGARVNPPQGSKQEGIMMFKQYFGAKPVYGFIWKYPIKRLKSAVYSLGVRLLRGGDIVDAEHHKLRSAG